MRQAPGKALTVVVLALGITGAVDAQTACDQLLPVGLVPPAGGFALGCANPYAFRLGSWSGSGASGIALALDRCSNGPCAGLTGPTLFVCATANGYACCIDASQWIPMAAGNYAGPLRAGLDQRFASDSDTTTGICFSEYAGNGARLCTVPLIQPPGNGSTQVQVVGFVRMFVSGPTLTSTTRVEFVSGPTPAGHSTWGQTKIRYR